MYLMFTPHFKGFVITDRSISSHSLDPGLWITWRAATVGLNQRSALTQHCCQTLYCLKSKKKKDSIFLS